MARRHCAGRRRLTRALRDEHARRAICIDSEMRRCAPHDNTIIAALFWLSRRRRSPDCLGRRWAPRCQTSKVIFPSANEGLQLTRRRRCRRARSAMATWARRAANRTAPLAASTARGVAPRMPACRVRRPRPKGARPLRDQSFFLPRKLNVPRVPLHIFKLRPGLRAGADSERTAVAPASRRPAICQCRLRFRITKTRHFTRCRRGLDRLGAARQARSESTQTRRARRGPHALRLPGPRLPSGKIKT